MGRYVNKNSFIAIEKNRSGGDGISQLSFEEMIKEIILQGFTYTESIYEGTKNINGTEKLASGVTRVRIQNVVSAGTIQLSVDGVVLTPDFDTTTDTIKVWEVSGINVTWVMTGVTQFDLGQGVS